MRAWPLGWGWGLVCGLTALSGFAETGRKSTVVEPLADGTGGGPASPVAPETTEPGAALPGGEVDPFAGEGARQALTGTSEDVPAVATDDGGPAPCDAKPLAPPEDDPVPRRTTWDPRSGYGLCPEVCGQSDACADGRCVSRCSPSCRDGTYCTAAGECLPMPRPPRELETEADLQTRHGSPSRDSHYATFIDLGGILFHGARPSFEWGARHALQARLLLLNTGLMNYFVEPETEYETFEWGFGASLGYRHYEARFGNLRGFFYGGGLGYAITEARDEVDMRYVVYNHALSVYGEFGYRWVFNHFLFGFGPSLGLRVPLCAHYSPLDVGGSAPGGCQFEQPVRFDGTMSLEVGWFP